MVVLFRAGGAALLVREMLRPALIGCIFTAAHAYVNKTRVDLLPFNVLGPKLKALGHPRRPRQAQPWGEQQVPVIFIKNLHRANRCKMDPERSRMIKLISDSLNGLYKPNH